jgi:hypothetical protein
MEGTAGVRWRVWRDNSLLMPVIQLDLVVGGEGGYLKRGLLSLF